MNRLRPLFVRSACALAAVATASYAQEDGYAPKSFWLPERSTNHALPIEIDRLFNLILWITGVTMVGVFVVLLAFLVLYKAKPGKKAFYTHGSHKLEIAWTIAPALILLWLALIQANTWLDIKAPDRMPKPNEATVVRVVAQQFAWNFRHAGADGQFERFESDKFDAAYTAWKTEADAEAKAYLKRVEDAKAAGQDPSRVKSRLPRPKKEKVEGDEEEEDDDSDNLLVKPNVLADEFWGKQDDDDVVSSGELLVPVGKPVLLDLRSVDVLHSFYLPHFRLKQDAVPGKPMPVWFVPTKVGVFEIACAELCGNLHTTMKGTMRVVTQAEFDAEMAKKTAEKRGKINRGMSSANSDVWRAWGAQDKQIIEARLR
jgi:heme/copper-type cytochrome/quinol oxidase subunit 2